VKLLNVGGANNTDYSRITGLATGMDTNGLVNQMLMADRLRITSVMQRRQVLEWQQATYVDIIKNLKNFERSFLDIAGPSQTNMMTALTYSGVKAESSESSKVNATALPGAMKGNYSVRIEQLAQGAKASSEGLNSINENGDVDLNTTLNELGISVGTITFEFNDRTFIVQVNENETISQFLNSVRNTRLNDNSTDVLGNHINISFSELTGKINIETKSTGMEQTMKISGHAADRLGISGDFTGRNSVVHIMPPGEGNEVRVERTSNRFTIDNVQYNIVNGRPNDVININIRSDSDNQVQKFKKFVEEYNSLIEGINNRLNERRNLKYKPLSDEQKKDMSEEEIKKWGEQAQKGLIARDPALSTLLMKVRQAFTATVQGAGITLADIGITTSSNWRDGGKLEINEEKLKEALENRGDQVRVLFTQSSDNDNEKGILQRIKDAFNTCIGSDGILIRKAGFENTRWVADNQLSHSIEAKNKSIAALERKMFERQEQYFRMFASLEKNMNRLNSQSSWLYSQMGMM
jgi:flagellar hook-associated protein 2